MTADDQIAILEAALFGAIVAILLIRAAYWVIDILGKPVKRRRQERMRRLDVMFNGERIFNRERFEERPR
jgi:hypothetical protein